MHLVTTLAAGIAGAENGTAEIYQRGTTLTGTYYTDFEAGAPPNATGLVALDSYGGATIYVQQLCNIVVKTLGGVVIREFVAGVRDDSVEVVSPSFSGESYDTLADGPNFPTTLGKVLDLWTSLNGGVDWKVALPDGSSLPISEAIAPSYGLVFNVRAFNAVGDGVANDTNAINSAINAATAVGGGVVYFPPGTYRTAGNHVVAGNIALIGAGSTATSVMLDNFAAGRLFQLTASPSSDRYQLVANMRLASVALASSATMFDFSAGARVLMSDMYLDGTNFPGHVIFASQSSATDFIITATVFQLGPSGRALTVSSSGTLKRGAFRDCRFITPVTYVPTSVIIGNFLDLASCVFDSSVTTTGAYSYLSQNTASINWNITGCTFGNAAGATVSAINIDGFGAAANIVEADNFFGTTVTAYVYTITGSGSKGAQVQLKSRELRTLYMTDNTAAPNLPLDQYGMVVLTSSLATTAIVFGATARPPEGARGTIVVVRTGTAGTVQAGTNFLNPVATAAYGAGAGCIWEYRMVLPSSTLRMALTVDGRSLGASV